MFTDSTPGEPDAAFIERNDGPASEITSLVRAGYLVRARTDADLKEAKSNDTRRRDAMMSSGPARLIEVTSLAKQSASPPPERHSQSGCGFFAMTRQQIRVGVPALAGSRDCVHTSPHSEAITFRTGICAVLHGMPVHKGSIRVVFPRAVASAF